MDKSPCSGAALLLTDELSALSQTPASHTSWAKQQNAETLAVTQPVAKVPLVGENCEESRQLLQWEAISNARRWQSISPGNTAGKRRKKKKTEKKGYEGEGDWKAAGDGDQGGYPVLRVPFKARCLLPGWGQAVHPQAAATAGCSLRASPVLQSAAGVTCQHVFPHVPWESRGTGRMLCNRTDQERGMVSKNR